MKSFTACLAMAMVGWTTSVGAGEIGADKKVLVWGNGQTNTSYMRQNVEAMDKSPFDGVIFEAMAATASGPVSFSGKFWGARRFTEDELKPVVDDLKATHFTRLTDNFLRINVTPGDVDWFDPEFDSVIANAKLVAKVASASGVRGILLDPEMYTQPVWVYGGQKYHAERSYEAYCKQVRLRGRQFMEAIQSEWKEPLIFLTYAWTQVAMDPAPMTEMKGYGLLPSFLDGWLDVAKPGTTIVDGFEQSYTYRDDEQFAQARAIFNHTGEAISTVPQAYRDRVKQRLWPVDGPGCRLLPLERGRARHEQAIAPSSSNTPYIVRSTMQTAMRGSTAASRTGGPARTLPRPTPTPSATPEKTTPQRGRPIETCPAAAT